MSDALQTAIYKRLAGFEDLSAYSDAAAAQSALAGLLGVSLNESGGAIGPAIGEKFTDEMVQLPQLAFRKSGGSEPIDGHDFGVRADVIFDFEYYEPIQPGGANVKANYTGSSVLDAIDSAVETLLDLSFRKAPTMTLSAGKCFWSDALTEMAVLYDDKTNLRFGLRRFRFSEARV